MQVVLDLSAGFERLVLEGLDTLLDRAGSALFGLNTSVVCSSFQLKVSEDAGKSLDR